MTYAQLAEKVLRETKTPMTPEEIWDYAKSKGYDRKLTGKGKTPWSSIGAVLYVSVRDNRKSQFGKTNTRPARFYVPDIYGSEVDINELADKETLRQSMSSGLSFSEKDLHPFLSYFAYAKLHTYTKTIRHSKSRKNQYGEWLHPDMVGAFFPSSEWEKEVTELDDALKDPAGNPSIISYELKKEINITNLREVFFQAVSNSSWANQSYLATAKISENEDFLRELSRLSGAFDIGVIRIDTDDPDSSEIMFSANFREELDWETINKLSSMNADFREFLKRIKNDVSSGEIRKEQYDKVLERETLIDSINRRG